MALNIDIVILSDADFYPPTINAANILAERGHHVRLIDIHYPKAQRQQLHPSVQRIHYGKHRRNLRNAWQYFSFYAWYAFMVRKQKPQWIIAYDAMAVGPVSVAARLYGIKWLYHNHDLFTNPQGWYKFIHWTDLRLAKTATAVSFPQEDRANSFSTNARLSSKPLVVFNGPRRSWGMRSLPVHAALRDWKEQDKFIVLYQGQFSKYFNLGVLISAMAFLPQRFVLCMIGRPLEEGIKEQYKDIIAAEGLQERVRLLDPITYDEIPAVTAYASLGISKLGMDRNIPFNDFYLTGASNKISEYLAFGLPVLMADTEVNREFYTKYGFAVFANGNEPRDVAKAIESLAEPATHAQLKLHAQQAGKEIFNYDAQFQKIVSLVEEK